MLYSSTSWEAAQMPKYEVIIYWSEEDKAFIAEVAGTSRLRGRRQNVSRSPRKTWKWLSRSGSKPPRKSAAPSPPPRPIGVCVTGLFNFPIAFFPFLPYFESAILNLRSASWPHPD